MLPQPVRACGWAEEVVTVAVTVTLQSVRPGRETGATKVDQLQLKRITVRATHREFQSDNGAENCQSFMTQVTPSHLQAVVFNLVTSFFP